MKFLIRNLFFWFTLILIPVCAQSQSSGLLWDDDDYEKLPVILLADKSDKLERVSYRQYLPAVLDQGNFMTCVGFTCAYYLQTAVEAKIRGISDPATINKIASSPVYLYQKIKSPDDYDCRRGVSLTKGLAFLKTQPVASYAEYPYTECESPVSVSKLMNPFQIGNYHKLFETDETASNKVQKLKAALAAGFPIAAGLSVPQSFMKLHQSQWIPTKKELSNPYQYEGHALCIVGYDNKYLGGAFQIVNSFGKKWGNNGYCWVKYDDLAPFVRYGFQVVPKLMNKETASETSSGIIQLQLTDSGSKEILIQYDENSLLNSKPLPNGTSVKILAKTSIPVFIYLYSKNEAGDNQLIFPVANNAVPINFPKELTNIFNNASITLSQNNGVDDLLFLLSETELSTVDPKQLQNIASISEIVVISNKAGLMNISMPLSKKPIFWTVKLKHE